MNAKTLHNMRKTNLSSMKIDRWLTFFFNMWRWPHSTILSSLHCMENECPTNALF